MSNRHQPAFENVKCEGFGRQRGISAREIGQTDELDPAGVLRRLFYELLRFGCGVIAAQYQFSRIHEFARVQYGGEKVRILWAVHRDVIMRWTMGRGTRRS